MLRPKALPSTFNPLINTHVMTLVEKKGLVSLSSISVLSFTFIRSHVFLTKDNKWILLVPNVLLTIDPAPFLCEAIAIICHFNMTWQGGPTNMAIIHQYVYFVLILILEYHYYSSHIV